MRDHSIAGTVRFEALLLWAQNLAGFDIVRSKCDYASSPKLVKGVG